MFEDNLTDGLAEFKAYAMSRGLHEVLQDVLSQLESLSQRGCSVVFHMDSHPHSFAFTVTSSEGDIYKGGFILTEEPALIFYVIQY